MRRCKWAVMLKPLTFEIYMGLRLSHRYKSQWTSVLEKAHPDKSESMINSRWPLYVQRFWQLSASLKVWIMTIIGSWLRWLKVAHEITKWNSAPVKGERWSKARWSPCKHSHCLHPALSLFASLYPAFFLQAHRKVLAAALQSHRMNRWILEVSTENMGMAAALQSYLKAPSQHVKLRQGGSLCPCWTLSTGFLICSSQKNVKPFTSFCHFMFISVLFSLILIFFNVLVNLFPRHCCLLIFSNWNLPICKFTAIKPMSQHTLFICFPLKLLHTL